MKEVTVPMYYTLFDVSMAGGQRAFIAVCMK